MDMRTATIVAGNWKMNTDAEGAAKLMNDLLEWHAAHTGAVRMIVAPPFPFLAMAVERAKGSGVLIAAQNCHQQEEGAFTGEVAAPMLRSLGVQACIVGHSERRAYFGETDELVGAKARMLLQHGLMPIVCCGERQEERTSGRFKEVVAAQLRGALSGLARDAWERIIIAYEPVWAIGTGLTATPAQAQEVHAFIRAELAALAGPGAAAVPILYGGSCKPDNAEGLFSQPDINGGLIGGASLKAAPFTELVRIAETVKGRA
jgi:triosephosphate isomerase